MSNFFKKVTSTVSVVAIVASAMSSTLVANAASQFAPYADALATAGIISKQTTEAGYNLGNNVTRAEMAKVAVNIKKAEVKECTGTVFSDVTATLGDLCGYVEAAANAGLVNKTAAKFRPLDLVTRAEMIKMLLGAQGIAPTDEDQGFKDLGSDASLNGYINAAAKAGIINKATAFNPNNNASRGEAFKVAANSTGLTTSAVEGTGDDDLDLGDLFGDDDTTSTGTTSTGTTDTTVKAGDLEVSLAASTPAAADLPASAEGVAVAAFDVTAGGSDVSISSIKLTRKGLGAGASVDNVALFANGTRVSKAKSFNSSDDTADVVLSPALVVKAGSTVTVIAKVTTTATAGTFAVELTDMTSSALSVKGTKVMGSSFEVKASPTATAVTVDDDSSVTTPKLGTMQAEVLKFKMSATTTNHEDVTLSEITLKEDGSIDETSELANVALYFNGAKVADAVSNGTKYFTFKMATPIVIAEGKTEKFVVKADIIGGAGETINFVVDNDLDVAATASKYGYVSITDSLAGTVLTVQAGEVTLIQIDPTSTEVRRDKNDIVLGTIKVVSKAGKALELEKFKVTIQNTDSSAPENVSALLENVELFDVTAGTVYDLTASAASTTMTFAEEVNIAMPTELTLAIRADTLDVAGINGAKFVASVSYDTVSTATAGTFAIKETGDDKYVTDVTPSAITFKTVNGTSSSLSINTVAMSSTKSAVIGSKGIEGLIFELKSDNDSSDLTVNELKVKGVVVDNSSTTTTLATTTVQVATAPADAETLTIGSCVVTFEAGAGAGNDNSATAANDTDCTGGATINTVTVANPGVALTAAQISAVIDTLTNVTDATHGALTVGAGAADTTTVFTEAVAITGELTSTDGTAGNVVITDTAGIAAANDGADVVMSNARVNAVYLYNGTTLVDQVSGSSIGTDGVATFDGFNIKIAKNSSVRFTVTTDILDAAANANDTLRFNLAGYSVEDEDADDVFANEGGLDAADDGTITDDTLVRSARTVTIRGAGTLANAVDNTDTETSTTKNILGGATSPFVASYELTATNEGVLVKDFTIAETNGAVSLANAVSEIIVYANDKTTELARKTVTSDTITFDNVNFTVEEGSENIYVKVVASKQGKDQAGAQTADLTLTFLVTDAEGASSNKVVTAPAVTAASNAFSVLPVKVSAVTMVQSGGGASLASTLSHNVTQVLGVIAVTTDSSTNTDSTDGSSLKTALQGLTVTVEGGLVVNALTLTRVNGTDTDGTVSTTNGGVKIAGNSTMVFDATALTGEDSKIDNGTTVYFKIEGQTQLTVADSESVAVRLIGLNSGNLTYKSDDAAANNDLVSALRIGYDSVSGISIKE